MQTIIVNKFAIGLMAMFVMLNFNYLFKNGTIDTKIYKHENNQFYGDLIIKDKKLLLIVKVDDIGNGNSEKIYNENKQIDEKKEINEDKTYKEDKEIYENKHYNEQKEHNINNNINKKEEIINKDDQNINKKEEKFNENIRITDDKTPGSIEIIIKNGIDEVNITRKIGSGDMSDIDKEICRKSIDAVTDYIQSIKGNGNSNIKKGVIDSIKGFKDYISREKGGRWFKW